MYILCMYKFEKFIFFKSNQRPIDIPEQSGNSRTNGHPVPLHTFLLIYGS